MQQCWLNYLQWVLDRSLKKCFGVVVIFGLYAPESSYGNSIEYQGDSSALATVPRGFGAISNLTNSLFPDLTGSASSGNSLIINYQIGTDPNYVIGGMSNVAGQSSSNNQITLNSGTILNDIYSGYAYVALGQSGSTNNGITINGGRVSGSVYSGRAYAVVGDAIADANTVSISGDGEVLGRVYGGWGFSSLGNAQANDNSVNIGSRGKVAGNVYGAYNYTDGSGYQAVTRNNRVNLYDQAEVTGYVFGGWAESPYGNSLSSDNSVRVNNALVNKTIYGGRASLSTSSSGTAITENNTIYISSGTVLGELYGGHSFINSGNGRALSDNNQVIVQQAVIAGNIYGGRASANSATNAASSGNSVTIIDSVIDKAVYGGWSSSQGGEASATHNTVILMGETLFSASNSHLYGGYSNSGDAFTGNTLNFHAQPIQVNNVANFEYYHFVIPAQAINGSSLISATGTVAVDKAKIEVKGIAGGSVLQNGDKITLIDATHLTGSSIPVNSKVMQGISVIYDIEVEQLINQIVATVVSQTNTSGLAGQLNPKTKALLAGKLAGLALIRQGTDMFARQLWQQIDQQELGVSPFILLETGKNRYQTGSYIDLTSVNWSTGLALKRDQWAMAGFFESGSGRYHSFNQFAEGDNVYGQGNVRYYGLGWSGRVELDQHIYFDSLLSHGLSYSDFSSRDLSTEQVADYNSKSHYTSAYIGAGYRYSFAADRHLDLSSHYLWTRMRADKLRIVGDPYQFETMNSHRLNVMANLSRDVNSKVTIAGELGYEYEFDAKAKAAVYSVYGIDGSGLIGGSGIAGVGVRIKPLREPNLSINLRLRGYAGQRQGVNSILQANYTF